MLDVYRRELIEPNILVTVIEALCPPKGDQAAWNEICHVFGLFLGATLETHRLQLATFASAGHAHSDAVTQAFSNVMALWQRIEDALAQAEDVPFIPFMVEALGPGVYDIQSHDQGGVIIVRRPDDETPTDTLATIAKFSTHKSPLHSSANNQENLTQHLSLRGR